MARLLIAEDDPLTLSGIELLVRGSVHSIVATVADGDAALSMARSTDADVLILDVEMPKRSGIEVLRELRGAGDRRPVILLTGKITDQRAYEALQLGLEGLVIKTRAPEVLLTCVESVLHGRRWIDHEMLQRAMEVSLTGEAASVDPLRNLSAREQTVVQHVLKGLRNRDIAEQLGVTEGTIKVHLHNIFEKLDVSSRTELVLMATRNG
jgi:two-component system, NarL family, nitrate/nitrite response regulator NarL